MNKWRLFAPPEDWHHPIEIDESSLPLLTELGERLGMRVGRDDAQQKFFLGLPKASRLDSSGSGEGVKYPSGLSIPKAVLSEAEAARYGTTGVYTAAPLLASRPDDRLSANFRASEFMCHDSSYKFLRVAPELVRRLEIIRKNLGGPAITVHSGYRPPAYNRAIPGAEFNSTHIDGLAADISAVGIGIDTLRKVCEAVIGDDGGLGYYPSQQFCHIDVRGYRSRWSG